MLVVIDTNILVNALKSNDDHAKSVLLMDDIYAGKHTMCVSQDIMDEYREVLYRPELNIKRETILEVLRWIDDFSFHIEPLPTTQEQVDMKDEDDRIFFDVAKCLNARLITRNYKHYPVHELVTIIDELY